MVIVTDEDAPQWFRLELPSLLDRFGQDPSVKTLKDAARVLKKIESLRVYWKHTSYGCGRKTQEFCLRTVTFEDFFHCFVFITSI